MIEQLKKKASLLTLVVSDIDSQINVLRVKTSCTCSNLKLAHRSQGLRNMSFDCRYADIVSHSIDDIW